MTIAETLQKARAILAENGIENPGLESRILLAHVCNVNLGGIILIDHKTLRKNDNQKYFDFIEKRTTKYPVAYLTGNKEFFSIDFKVNSSVLIPRPETEELIEWVMEQNLPCERMLDLCAGTGCVGIALALNYPVKTLRLSDRSEEALEVAKYNAKNLFLKKTDLNWATIQSDLMNNIREQFDLIVTNPPYVLPDEYKDLSDDVRKFEPKIALVVEDYKSFFTRLLEQTYEGLYSGGSLFIETNPLMVSQTLLIMKEIGFTGVETRRDLSGKLRFIKGQKPKN
ncbi:MAG: peptide chain release factor N(5)-glutamine methyltransferase [Leptospirales bacterium]